MSVVHFSVNNGTALACGRTSGNVTIKRGDVSCQKCKATRAFKEDLGFHPSGEIDEGFTSGPHKATPEQVETLREGLRLKEAEISRVSPPLVQVTWETFSDFVKEYPDRENLAIAGAISFGDELGLETWVDVRDNGPFYWKAGG